MRKLSTEHDSAYGQLISVIIVLQLRVRDYVSQTYELDRIIW